MKRWVEKAICEGFMEVVRGVGSPLEDADDRSYSYPVLSCFGRTFTTRSLMPRGGDQMKAYELLFFVDPALDPETRLAVMKRIDNTIAEGNGKVDNVDEWGKRKLAYEINKLTEGDYTLINFHADPTQIAELDRVLRITDAVVRHMIVRRDDQE